ncbi:hypothetical protein [Flagellimonas sp. 2504JD4-2]
MKTTILFLSILLTLSTVQAQWTDNGTNLTTTDNVGVGTTTPSGKLEILKDANLSSSITLPNSGLVLRADNDGNDASLRFGVDNTNLKALIQTQQTTTAAKFDLLLNPFGGNIGIGTISPQSKLQIKQDGPSGLRFVRDSHDEYELLVAGTKGLFVKNRTDGVDEMVFDGTGNVGIGTSDPVNRLHVKGNTLGAVAGDQSMITTIEGSVDGNNSKFQILNKRNSNGTNWNNTSLRLQRTVDSTPQAFIDFGIENENSNYGLAFGTRNGFGGTQQTRMVIEENGYVGIGTTSPDARLAVNGNIHTKEVKVDLVGWPDYVFEKDYRLPTLEEVEKHININGHLKDIPTAKEVEENGVFLGEMDSKLLQKIEELTLYTIQQQKEIQQLKQENSKLQSLSERLEQVESLLGQKE